VIDLVVNEAKPQECLASLLTLLYIIDEDDLLCSRVRIRNGRLVAICEMVCDLITVLDRNHVSAFELRPAKRAGVKTYSAMFSVGPDIIRSPGYKSTKAMIGIAETALAVVSVSDVTDTDFKQGVEVGSTVSPGDYSSGDLESEDMDLILSLEADLESPPDELVIQSTLCPVRADLSLVDPTPDKQPVSLSAFDNKVNLVAQYVHAHNARYLADTTAYDVHTTISKNFGLGSNDIDRLWLRMEYGVARSQEYLGIRKGVPLRSIPRWEVYLADLSGQFIAHLSRFYPTPGRDQFSDLDDGGYFTPVSPA